MFPCRPLNSKIHMAFSMFSGYQEYGKNYKNIGKKCSGVSILFQPNLANLQPVTALISTAGKPSSGGPQTTFTVNHKPQSNLYEKFKGFVEVTLYNINKRGCTLYWRSLDAVPYLIRWLIDQRPQGKQKFSNTNFTWMRIYMLIYLVWIIMFNSWYKHGMEKNDLKILNCPCGSL